MPQQADFQPAVATAAAAPRAGSKTAIQPCGETLEAERNVKRWISPPSHRREFGPNVGWTPLLLHNDDANVTREQTSSREFTHSSFAEALYQRKCVLFIIHGWLGPCRIRHHNEQNQTVAGWTPSAAPPSFPPPPSLIRWQGHGKDKIWRSRVRPFRAFVINCMNNEFSLCYCRSHLVLHFFLLLLEVFQRCLNV